MRTLSTLVLLATIATSAAAQGTLSTQGFGYPAGGLSTHAEALGGSIAESDPLSPVNPASLNAWGRPGFYLQYDPEYRTVQAPGVANHTIDTRRFPGFATRPTGSAGGSTGVTRSSVEFGLSPPPLMAATT